MSTRVFITFALKTTENPEKVDKNQNLSLLFNISVAAEIF